MPDDIWTRAKQILELALEVSDSDRAALPDRESRSGADLRGQVEALLGEHRITHGFLAEKSTQGTREDNFDNASDPPVPAKTISLGPGVELQRRVRDLSIRCPRSSGFAADRVKSLCPNS